MSELQPFDSARTQAAAMRVWPDFSPVIHHVADRCARLHRRILWRGYYCAAFHVPEHFREAMSRELWADPEGNLLILGLPVYFHDAHRGILAERGKRIP